MDHDSPELNHVLRGLALNRAPGWNFPGNFLDLSFDEVTGHTSSLSLDPGPHCVDADGQLNLAALCILADVGMAVAMRDQLGYASRMATVSMSLRFTGLPRVGRLTLRGQLEGFVHGADPRQGLARAEIHAGEALVCSASSVFIGLGNPNGLAPLPMLKREARHRVAALTREDLNDDEREVFGRAAEAAREAGRAGGAVVTAPHGADRAPASFIERFWGLLPRRTEGGAVCDFANGQHVGNRVGHTQGGITFGLAALTSNVAVGEGWQLAGASASYLSPGAGPVLTANATFLHRGRLTAVVRTDIRDPSGKLVLDAVTHHARIG